MVGPLEVRHRQFRTVELAKGKVQCVGPLACSERSGSNTDNAAVLPRAQDHLLGGQENLGPFQKVKDRDERLGRVQSVIRLA